MPADITLNSGSGGAIIATDPTTSSEHYQLIKLAQGAVGTFTLVTTANAFPVVTGSSFQGGITSLSSQITVTATAGTNPWSSAPGFNVPVVSVSSGLVQLSSQITVTATGPVTVTSGLISVTSGTITSTAATNPWSSAPGFNLPVVSVSSGLVQVSAVQVSPTSSVAGAGLLVITSSFGMVTQSTQPITITSGTVTLSSVHTVTATAGTNPWSSAPGFNLPVVSVSSGLVQLSSQITVTATGPVTITSGTVTLSSVHTVTATAGTNPWSSAPGFNVPVVNVSSGLVQTFALPAFSTRGLLSFSAWSTGAVVVTNITTAQTMLAGWAIYNSTAAIRGAKIYNTTAPTAGSTAGLMVPVTIPGSTGGGGSNLSLGPYGVFTSNGISMIITSNPNATDTGTAGANDVAWTVFYV